jgi:hypothetical protein
VQRLILFGSISYYTIRADYDMSKFGFADPALASEPDYLGAMVVALELTPANVLFTAKKSLLYARSRNRPVKASAK